jgi:type II secretory ATPase GspE/PulE/Tfp pilus assembly ATPase PilB-like protein
MVTLRSDVLAARLRDLGIATPKQIEQARQELNTSQERFSAILVRHGVLRDPDIGKRLAPQLGSVPQTLSIQPAPTPAARHIAGPVWRSQRLAPFRQDQGRLLVATDDPFSVFALDLLGSRCGCQVEAVLIEERLMTPLLEGIERTLAATDSPAPAAAAPAAPPKPAAEPLQRPAAPPATAAPAAPAGPKSSGPLPAPTAAGLAAAGATLIGKAASVPAPPPAAAPAKPAAPALPSRPQPTGDAAADIGDEPIIQLVDSILAEAVRMRASDIHIEPAAHDVRVRYRVDGVLHDVNSSPRALHGPIISRIKILGGLNIAEKRLPQDGRLQLAVEGRPLDVRISTLPAMHGESVVLRLLDRSQPVRGLAEMGMLPQDQAVWDQLIHRPHGMVLVTGPTGSGKTTTLYGALSTLNQPDRKLITVEDPVEYQLSGVNQVLVKSSIGLTFAAGLRAMLRQAPDVIMVGEIRDPETAQIAIQAALTGHLVFSTLHTNDAPSAITRLIDMGIAPFLVASTVQGVLAQRLVRRICQNCRLTDNATEEEKAFLGAPDIVQLIRSNGCEQCHGSGFLGRVGIYELLVISEPVRQLIVAKASASDIRAAAAKEGMRGLRADGSVKIREGLTTMAEVLRVITDRE